MGKKSTLNSKFIALSNHNKDGSYATRSNRLGMLKMFGRHLSELGYVLSDPKSLKPKHIEALISDWQKNEIATSTIKNRMSNLRWWAEKIGKKGIIKKNNSDYGIEKRQYVSHISKGKTLERDKFFNIPCTHIRGSLLLQREFGLRREEAIKFSYHYAYQGDHIKLKGTWCKGGKEREIPITTDSQKKVLEYVRKNGSNGNLIPASKNYIQQLKRYERYTSLVGLSKMHGLRHEFAQNLYAELTGWASPAKGGWLRREMDPRSKENDRVARLEISKRLGHERISIVAIYLGGT